MYLIRSAHSRISFSVEMDLEGSRGTTPMEQPENVSFTEKYRPTSFRDIVLQDTSRQIFDNILKTRQIPNLLLHGPPGTGKTTAILNLKKHLYTPSEIRELTVHLNASDDRGVYVVRKQIALFARSKPLFHRGCKLIVLDEIDSMTPAAQKELITVIETYRKNADISFILMCNYYSRLDTKLIEHFVRIPFSFLEPEPVIDMIRGICAKERIEFKHDDAEMLYEYYDNDIRSILNHIQTNGSLRVIGSHTIGKLHDFISEDTSGSVQRIAAQLIHLCAEEDIGIDDFIHFHVKYIQANHPDFFMTHIDDFKYILIQIMEEDDISKLWFHVSVVMRK